jgi:FkbM family methyltransferase
VNLFATIRRHWHPLHHLRKKPLFQKAVQRCDPIVQKRIAGFSKPVSLRLLAHASLILSAEEIEAEIRKTFETCSRVLPPSGFWDVGANIGFFSFSYAMIHPNALILSFEPDRRNLQCLERTSNRWRLPRHKIIPAAVADFHGRASFVVDRLSGATGALQKTDHAFNRRHYAAAAQIEELDVVTLDEFFDSAKPPAIIKIDVEGAELAVLRGAKRVLSESKPVLIFESFESADACLEILRPAGYRAWDADRYASVSSDTINFLAVPNNAPDMLLKELSGLGYPV